MSFLIVLLEIMLSVVMLAGGVGLLVLPKDDRNLMFALCFMAIYHTYRRLRRAQHEAAQSYLTRPSDPLYDEVLYGDLSHDRDKTDSHN